MELKEAFAQAAAVSKQLPTRPDNETLLRIYSLYKQATEGDNQAEAPNMFDFVAKAKYDAWQKLKGLDKEDAMQRYIDLIAELKK